MIDKPMVDMTADELRNRIAYLDGVSFGMKLGALVALLGTAAIVGILWAVGILFGGV